MGCGYLESGNGEPEPSVSGTWDELPPLPKPLSYVWPENDCNFPCHYTPAGPGGPFGPPRSDGLKSFPIYTAEQMLTYARAAVELSRAKQAAQPQVSDSDLKECFDAIDFSQMVTADDLFYMIARAVLKKFALSQPAAQSAQVPEPKVTSHMMNQGADAMREGMAMLNSGRSYQAVCEKIFLAMIAAAPQPDQGDDK
jgi:hypothetical protein